jgi:hypothetical protein
MMPPSKRYLGLRSATHQPTPAVRGRVFAGEIDQQRPRQLPVVPAQCRSNVAPMSLQCRSNVASWPLKATNSDAEATKAAIRDKLS